ncbi:MAG TPA: glucokinase [Vicinamibacterales bacterium]|jgi:glucokinase
MLLAGDIGGTKTLLGLFDPSGARPRPVAVRAFGSLEYDDLPPMIDEFMHDGRVRGSRVDAACFGVAGPVIGQAAKPTNVPWTVDARVVSTTFTLPRVSLLNDLEAMAYAVPVLHASEVHVLQDGEPLRGGNMALIAAGTGLGEALLHSVNGRLIPSPSEGGHADFAARTEREITILRALTKDSGRADVEHVVSGRGLLNIYPVAHHHPCAARIDLNDPDAPAMISSAALDRRCDGCVETLDIFVEAYGAEAGNLALRVVATGGVFIGGGIAPKILPALESGAFMAAFRAKPPLDAMLSRMPVKVILNTEAGLLGAAVYAAAT